MGLMERLKAMNMELDSLDTLFKEQLQECYNIKNQVVGALPEMISAVSSPQLKSAFQQHLEDSQRQKGRIEQIFHEFGQEPKEEKSEGMAGIIEEGQILAHARGKPEVKDAALIGVAQAVEHFEMAAYGTLRSFATHLGHPAAADMLQQSLNEERRSDKQLSEIAESGVNQEACVRQPGWQEPSGESPSI